MKLYRNKIDGSFHWAIDGKMVNGPYLTKEAALSDKRRLQRNSTRRARHQAMTSLGLSRVRGALGGTHYE